MGAGVAELLAQVGVWVTQVYMESSWVMVVYGYALGPHLWATELPIPLQEEISKCTWMLLCIPYFHPNPGPRSRAPCLPSLTITPHTLPSVQCSSPASCLHIPTNIPPHPQYPRVPLPPILPFISCYVLFSSTMQLYMMGRWGSGGAPGFWKDYGGPVKDWGGRGGGL